MTYAIDRMSQQAPPGYGYASVNMQSYNSIGSTPTSVPQNHRVRRGSMELNPGAVAAQFYQDGMGLSGSYKNQDPLSLLLGQGDPNTASAAMNGLLQHPVTAAISEKAYVTPGECDTLGMAGTSGYDNLPLEAEEPGPLPCLPRTGRMAGGYGASSAALFMQQQQLQQLQRCGYASSGAPGPGPGGRQARPRRHSVTIGMLNEHQQAAFLAGGGAGGQLPAGWLNVGTGPTAAAAAAAASAGAPRMPLLPQQSSPSKQLPGLSLQAAAAAAQLGMSKAGLGQAFMGGMPSQLPPQPGLSGAGVGGAATPGGYGGMEMPPAYDLTGPRMPGAGSSRRHSWAPMGAESSMAYARSWLLQQQQQRANLSAQLGDAGALFVNQQQQEQLGLGGLGGLGSHGQNGYEGAGNPLNGHAAGLAGPGLDRDAASSFAAMQGQISMGPQAQMLPLYGAGADACASQQLAQHLQQQLQQLQLQQQGYNGRLAGTGQTLDPYAEPFVSQAAVLPSAGALAGGLPGLDPYAAALQQELQQQQQSALAMQLAESGLSPDAAAAAATMYAPLQVNGVSVDTQLLVSPYADNWDTILSQTANTSLSGSGSAMSSGSGAALAGLGAGPAPPMGLSLAAAAAAAAAAKTKGLPQGPINSSGSGSAPRSNNNSSTLAVASSSNSKGSSSGVGATAPAAAAAAAASVLASLPPQSKVCSDAPWDLKKAAVVEESSTSAAQQLKKLQAALERSTTLQAVHAADDAAAEASAACAAAAAARTTGVDQSGADNAQALFGYRLPDSGDDTWGVSCLPSEAGGNCISQEPSNKLFVGNIGWWVTEEDLLHWFSRFGTVINVKIMYNSRKMHKPKDKWRSREYGFIDYASPEEAAKAIVWMDGVELPDLMKDTCGIIVQYAKPTGSQEGASGA